MISFVYFDVGGVVIQDFSGTNKWNEMLSDMGVNENNIEKFMRVWNRYKDRININIDADTLIPVFEKEVGLRFPDGYSFLLDFVNRFEINKSIWPVIDEIRVHCRVGLLTNMYPRMFEAIKTRGLIPNIRSWVVIDSSIEKVAKPSKKIFEIAQEKAKTRKDEILFVENSPQHLKAAQGFGWQTFLYDSAHPDISSHNLSLFFRDHVANC